MGRRSLRWQREQEMLEGRNSPRSTGSCLAAGVDAWPLGRLRAERRRHVLQLHRALVSALVSLSPFPASGWAQRFPQNPSNLHGTRSALGSQDPVLTARGQRKLPVKQNKNKIIIIGAARGHAKLLAWWPGQPCKGLPRTGGALLLPCTSRGNLISPAYQRHTSVTGQIYNQK